MFVPNKKVKKYVVFHQYLLVILCHAVFVVMIFHAVGMFMKHIELGPLTTWCSVANIVQCNYTVYQGIWKARESEKYLGYFCLYLSMNF